MRNASAQPHGLTHPHQWCALICSALYSTGSIANISSHAALAAAKGQNYNIGAKFTVTVDADGKIVREVPFVNKEGRGFQMNSDFWKVSPLYTRRRTVGRGSACKWDRFHLNPTLCATLQKNLQHVPTRLGVTTPEELELKKGKTVEKTSGPSAVRVLISAYQKVTN